MDALTTPRVWRFASATHAELATFRARIAADWSTLHTPTRARPFVLVSPAGRQSEPELARLLAGCGVRVTEKHACDDWPRRATAMYVRELDQDRLVRAFAYEQLWRTMFRHACAMLWVLDGERSLERARICKPALRHLVPDVPFAVQTASNIVTGALHAFHVPDAVDVEREWRVLWSERHALEDALR